MSHIVTADSGLKKRVLYVITKSQFGGAQRYVFDLAIHIPKDRFEVAVAMGGDGPLKERLSSAMIRTIEIKSFTRDVSLFHDISTLFELISLFKRERPDVVHLNSAKAVTLGALAARIARVPRIISTIHGWAHKEPRPWWQRILITIIERFGTLLAHATIVVAQADMRWGAVVIHNGIHPPTPLSRDEARHTLGVSRDAFVVGSIGELTKNKHYAALIEAVKPLDVTLVLIGDGEERHELKKRAGERTLFCGYLTDAQRYLSAFDVFVLPSKKEGLPYVLLDAGMAHLPVIATRVGGIPEILHDGVTGTVVAPGSADAITNALRVYRNNPELRKKHGAALNEHVRTSFSFPRMLERTLEMYR
jgi:glycosyltransferase involved in cell wall biosynthesis